MMKRRALGQHATCKSLVLLSVLLSIPLVLLCRVMYALHRNESSRQVVEEQFVMPFDEDIGVQVGEGAWEFPETLFTPEEFLAGRRDKYVNLPVLPTNVTVVDVERSVLKAINTKIGEPFGLMHKANPPGNDVFMGLAAWPKAMHVFQRLVTSFRRVSDGHMILGVHSEIPVEEQEYLKKMNVTFYSVEMINCSESIAVPGENTNNVVRGRCSKGHENLKLEWGRFAMAREWLNACKECTGWAMVADTRDLIFQANPFVGLPPPESSPYDLIFMEEISKHTCPKPQAEDSRRYYILENNGFYRGTSFGCYGEYHLPFKERPILCSGTIMGTRKGLDRFLAVYVEEFHANNKKEKQQCRSPHASDQMILQQMYYTGRFGGFERTKTMPWGMGPVNTIGHVCVDNSIANPNERHSAKDMVMFDKETGLILNNHEEDGSPFRISPIVHQWDRCHNWIHPFFREHPYLFEAK